MFLLTPWFLEKKFLHKIDPKCVTGCDGEFK